MQAAYSKSAAPADEYARELMAALESGMGLRTTLDYEQHLTAVGDDGTRTFRVTWHGYEFMGELAGKPIPPPPGHEEATRALLASTATMKTTAQGRTLDIAYSNPNLAALGASISRISESMPTYLPEGPIAVGGSWTSEADLPAGLPASGQGVAMKVLLVHTLREVRDDPDGPVAVIELTGSYSQLQGAETAEGASPMHMQLSLTGSTLFDIERGRFSGGSYELDMLALQNLSGTELELTGFAVGRLELVRER